MAVIFPNGDVMFEGVTLFRVFHSLADDDFLDVVVFEPESKTFKTVTVWTTAAACGGIPKVVEDAPEEARKAYSEELAKKDAEDFRLTYPKLAENGYTRADLTAIQMAYPFRSQRRIVDAIVRLLGTKSFKSRFRESLRDQVREWLASGGHEKPLSARQAEKITF